METIKAKIQAIKYIYTNLSYILNRHQKKVSRLLFVYSLFCALLQLFAVAMMAPIVSLMMEPDLTSGGKIGDIICDLLSIDNWEVLFRVLCFITIFLYVIKNLCGILQTWLYAKFSCMIERDLAIKVMDNYMHRTYDFFLLHDSASILRDVEKDPQWVGQFITAVFNIISEVLTALMIVAYIVVMDYRIALCVIVISIICLMIIYVYFKGRMKQKAIIVRDKQAEHQKAFQEAVQGIKEVQVMRKQDFFLKEYRDTYLEMQKPNIFIRVGGVCPTFVIEGLFVAGILFYISMLSLFDNNFAAMLPLLAAFAVGAIRLLPSLGRISNNLNVISSTIPALQTMTDSLMNVSKGEYGSVISGQEKIGIKTGFESELSLKEISWKYKGAKEETLKELNLTVKKGQSVGLVGQTGAGKSTLADIILGLHLPQKGQVLLDGMDIREIPDDYAKIIGYVPQTIYLVDGTIRENVAFGDSPADFDEEGIIDALKRAQMYDFIKELPKGLDTVIGERGVRFSGGQRQRLAIARALYRKPEILILDEATSALDNETEAAVMEAIENLYGTITMIIIAHRLTTVAKCDIVYEVKQGKVVKKTLD